MLSACPVSWWGTWGKAVFALQQGSKYKRCRTPHFLYGSMKFKGKELFRDLLSFLIYSLSISLVVSYLWVIACEALNLHSTLKGWQLSFHLQCSTEDSNQQPFNSEAFLFATYTLLLLSFLLYFSLPFNFWVRTRMIYLEQQTSIVHSSKLFVQNHNSF